MTTFPHHVTPNIGVPKIGVLLRKKVGNAIIKGRLRSLPFDGWLCHSVGIENGMRTPWNVQNANQGIYPNLFDWSGFKSIAPIALPSGISNEKF